MTMTDDDAGDDENCSERDDWLLDVPVHVPRLFVVAISFDDFETRSKQVLTLDPSNANRSITHLHLRVGHLQTFG